MRDGVKQPVWRCLNRLDYGKKYCKDSVTLDEKRLHQAIMAAISPTYNTVKKPPVVLTQKLRNAMRKQVDNSVDIEKLEQQVKSLVDKIMEMVLESQTCQNEFEYAQGEKQMQALSEEARRIQNIIDEYKANNDTEETIERKLLEAENYLENQAQDILEYNDKLVRHIIDTIQVMDANHIVIHFKNGIVQEQFLEPKVRKLKAQ